VHGPFVSDEEVERVVAHLKRQAKPVYLEEVTAEEMMRRRSKTYPSWMMVKLDWAQARCTNRQSRLC
jgi:DNA segregation ATPase FtsK/SpoIIIE-like protein